MGLWPWNVGQGHWNWVSVIGSPYGPYLWSLVEIEEKFLQKYNNKNIGKNNSLHHGNGEA